MGEEGGGGPTGFQPFIYIQEATKLNKFLRERKEGDMEEEVEV